MKNSIGYLMIGVLALGFFFVYTAAFGQRGSRVGAAGGARGGAVVGPYGGSAARASRGGTVVGPAGGSASRGATRGSYTTAGGATIDYAGAGRKATGPGGVSAGRGVGGVQVTGPGGQSATKVGRAGGVSGPGGNSAARRSSVGVASGPGGAAVGASRGGVATGPGGTVARSGRVGAATGPGGTVGGASRAGVALGPGGAVAGGSRVGVAASPYGLSRYAARGTVVAGHGTRYVAAGARTAQGAYVRRGFVHYNTFTPTWYRTYSNAWRAAAWTTAAAIWTGATWAALSSSCGYPAQPVTYDYGTTLVYEGDQVYHDGEPVATAEEYADQATQIASHGLEARPPETEEWVALGVFAMVQGEEKDANDIFQLAINRDGVIRGNFYNALSDTTVPVYGSVDRKTQRAAWTVGDRKDRIYETGIANLTEAETAMLVHFGKDRTQQWTLVRLEQPEEEK
jgi:hypothetical protein